MPARHAAGSPNSPAARSAAGAHPAGEAARAPQAECPAPPPPADIRHAPRERVERRPDTGTPLRPALPPDISAAAGVSAATSPGPAARSPADTAGREPWWRRYSRFAPARGPNEHVLETGSRIAVAELRVYSSHRVVGDALSLLENQHVRAHLFQQVKEVRAQYHGGTGPRAPQNGV